MSKCKVLFTSIAVVVCLSGLAQGMLVDFSTDAVSSWSPSGAVISQAFSSLAPAGITMNAEAHSTFTITTTTTNETGFDWTGYLLTLNPAQAATFVPASAGSTKFHTVQYPDAWTILFEAPLTVGQGQVVTLQFDVDIPDGASYMFTLTQTPIPEPATIALLGLGTLALLTRRNS